MKDLKKETEEILKLQKQLEESRGLQDHPKRQHIWNMAWGRCFRQGSIAVIQEYDAIVGLL
jgi:hypothetical protein